MDEDYDLLREIDKDASESLTLTCKFDQEQQVHVTGLQKSLEAVLNERPKKRGLEKLATAKECLEKIAKFFLERGRKTKLLFGAIAKRVEILFKQLPPPSSTPLREIEACVSQLEKIRSDTSEGKKFVYENGFEQRQFLHDFWVALVAADNALPNGRAKRKVPAVREAWQRYCVELLSNDYGQYCHFMYSYDRAASILGLAPEEDKTLDDIYVDFVKLCTEDVMKIFKESFDTAYKHVAIVKKRLPIPPTRHFIPANDIALQLLPCQVAARSDELRAELAKLLFKFIHGPSSSNYAAQYPLQMFAERLPPETQGKLAEGLDTAIEIRNNDMENRMSNDDEKRAFCQQIAARVFSA